MSEEKKTFAEWALVELMGHQRIVGYVTEQSIAGAAMLRVDVPDKDGQTRFTRFYGGGAIYAINPIGKTEAIALATRVDAEPIKAWMLPAVEERPEAVVRAETGDGDYEPGDNPDDLP